MNPTDPKNNSSQGNSDATREAAANIIRGQLDSLFSPSNDSDATTNNPPIQQSQEDAQKTSTSSKAHNPDIGPYERSYVETKPEIQQKEWDQYQTAWQDYYQKYYEKYYTQHYAAAQKALRRQKAGITASRQAYQKNLQVKSTSIKPLSGKAPTTAPPKAHFEPAKSNLISEKEATKRLRNKLQNRLGKGAEKVRKSRHFMPLMTAAMAVFLFLFLQYNQILISNVVAYVSPGDIDPKNIVIDTPDNIEVDPAARLIIPKINVDVPVHYDIGNDTKSQNTAMRDGLAHFSIPGANSHPGEAGNTAIAGHSSGDLFLKSDYKFIFAQLHKLEPGDKIYAHYNSKRYTYAVTGTEVVYPEQVDKLVYDTAGKPVITLITCTPLGTALQRLLVTAEQISPDPLKATAATVTAADTATIPGNEATWIEKVLSNMFGSDHN